MHRLGVMRDDGLAIELNPRPFALVGKGSRLGVRRRNKEVRGIRKFHPRLA